MAISLSLIVVRDSVYKINLIYLRVPTFPRTSYSHTIISITSTFLALIAFTFSLLPYQVYLPHSQIPFEKPHDYYSDLPMVKAIWSVPGIRKCCRNIDGYRFMQHYTIMFKGLCIDNSNNIDHSKFLLDLRRHTKVEISFNKASILHSELFCMTSEALKPNGVDRPTHPPPKHSLYVKRALEKHYTTNMLKSSRS